MNTVGLATSLIGMNLPNEALPLLASAEAAFEQQRRSGNDTLQVKFMLANVDLLRGWANVRFAEDPRTPVAQRAAYWRKARDLTARGIPIYEQVNEQYPIVDPEKRMWDDAIANRAKAEAALKIATNEKTRQGGSSAR